MALAILLLAVLLVLFACDGAPPPPSGGREPSDTRGETERVIRVDLAIDCALVLEKDQVRQQAKDVVALLIDRGRCDPEGYLFKGQVGLAEGQTPFAALEATGLAISYTNSAFGPYVKAIEGLGDGDGGTTSGWVYLVNGQTPSISSGLYHLEDGDRLQWRYSIEASDTMGDLK